MTRDEYKTREGNTKKSYWDALPDFFGPSGQPRLPGSSLRGMIRNLVEILGEGQFLSYSDNQLFYRAVTDRRAQSITTNYNRYIRPNQNLAVRAGFMVKNSGGIYKIRPAVSVNGHSFFQVLTTQAQQVVSAKRNKTARYEAEWGRGKVWFKPAAPDGNRSTPLVTEVKPRIDDKLPDNSTGWEKGWVIISGYIPKKKHSWIIPDATEGTEIPVGLDDLIAYRDSGGISAAIEEANFSVLPDTADMAGKVPCFFIQHTGTRRVNFGHTPYFRLPYDKHPANLIERQLPNLAEGQFDLVQSIFGVASSRDGKGAAGRVFFQEALPQGEVQWEDDGEVIIPQILANPKPTTFQHYLDQKEAEASNSPQDCMRSLKYWDSQNAKIRGYKLYWHRRPDQGLDWKATEQQADKAPTQYTRIKPLSANNTFNFRVRFDNLDKVELGVLAAALQLPAGYAHKLGMGKPLGLGSVRLETSLFLIDRAARYRTLFTYGENENGRQVSGWQSGEGVEAEDLTIYQNHFARWLAGDSREFSPTLANLWSTRLQELGLMLDYASALPPKQTRYMQIQPDNEYRDRPILPDPFSVKGITRLAKKVTRPDPLAGVEGDEKIQASAEDLKRLLQMNNPAKNKRR